MLTTPITLWVPMPPDNANGRQHWAAALGEKRRYWAGLNERRAIRHIPAPPPAAPDRARLDVLRVVEGSSRVCDTDNFVRRCKPLVDWLRTHGYVAGDDPARLAWGAVEQVRGPVSELRPPLTSVRITITPLVGMAAPAAP